MAILLKNATIYTPQGFVKKDLFVKDLILHSVDLEDSSYDEVIDCNSYILVPGFVDVHVHFREPGFLYKESIKTGSLAAARGGYTQVCTMPNLNPAPVDKASLQVQLDAIAKDACIRITPYACITSRGDGRSTLSKMEEMADFVVGFTDDGKGVQGEETMRAAMRKAKSLNKPIVAHCEEESLLHGGYIHDGTYSKAHGHRGICSKSEWVQVERDVALAEETGCAYHVCHVSTKESVDILRKAKARGVNVSGETAPHYLILCDEDLQEEGRFKMNPPLRSAEDRAALLAGIQDGTIEIIATDHAPHTPEEKSRGLEKSPFGIVGIECAFQLLYTCLVKTGKISLEKLLELLCVNPRKRFGLAGSGYIGEGEPADLTLLDLNAKYTIDPANFFSMGKATPFAGWTVQSDVVLTMVGGKIVYRNSI